MEAASGEGGSGHPDVAGSSVVAVEGDEDAVVFSYL